MEKAIHLELRYPNLALTEYAVTSPRSQEYNCFAWVAGDQERWWQPTPEDEFYWVSGVPMEETLSAYIQAYQKLGYAICDNAVLETGYEKIALYVNDEGVPTHAAKQLLTGKWSIDILPIPKGRGFSKHCCFGFLVQRLNFNQTSCNIQSRGRVSPDVYSISEVRSRMPYDTV